MRISDWSSDVCSSDLVHARRPRTLLVLHLGEPQPHRRGQGREARRGPGVDGDRQGAERLHQQPRRPRALDRKRVVEGKSVPVRVDLGGRRIIKIKQTSMKNVCYKLNTPLTRYA